MAVLDCLENTREHPTADQVLAAVRKTFPSVSRGTIYNTLEALTRAALILRITVDPAVARYDADLGPHAHFRCRICSTVYDIVMDKDFDLAPHVDGHHIEAVRAYAYGVCEKCLQKDPSQKNPQAVLNELTKNTGDSPSESAQRSPKGFSNEPTKSTGDSPAKEGGESPDA
jgi:Fe2+ or Zn2+ uptake regulation protein